jgi:hypothetical protein
MRPPSKTLKRRVPELPRWMVLDCSDVPQAAARVAAALGKVRDQPDPPTTAVIGDVVAVFGGTSIPQRDLVAGIAERDAEADVLARPRTS